MRSLFFAAYRFGTAIISTMTTLSITAKIPCLFFNCVFKANSFSYLLSIYLLKRIENSCIVLLLIINIHEMSSRILQHSSILFIPLFLMNIISQIYFPLFINFQVFIHQNEKPHKRIFACFKSYEFSFFTPVFYYYTLVDN